MQPTQAWKVPWSNTQVPTRKVMRGEEEVWQCRPTRIYTWASRHWVVWNLSKHLMFDCVSEYAGMMELAYISVSNTEFWGFDSLFPHHTYTPLTQSVEYHTFNVRVMGSSPIRCTICSHWQVVKSPPFHGGVVSSILTGSTIRDRKVIKCIPFVIFMPSGCPYLLYALITQMDRVTVF